MQFSKSEKRIWKLSHLAGLIFILPIVITSMAVAQESPCLEVYPESISFYLYVCDHWPDGNSEVKSGGVYNPCDGELTWAGSSADSWVKFEPTTGGNFDSIYIWLDLNEISNLYSVPQVGDTLVVNSSITITAEGASNSPQQIAVRLVAICHGEQGYILDAWPSLFHLNGSPGDVISEQFFVSERFGRNIDFQFSASSSWLLLPEISHLTTPDSVSFEIDASLLTVGTYVDTILINPTTDPPTSTEIIPVMLTISEGGGIVVKTDPTLFEITTTSDDVFVGDLYLYEEGGRSIPFQFQTQTGWAGLFGEPPYITPTILSVVVNTAGLAPGYYGDSIFIFPADADSSLFAPLAVPIFLHVTSPASIISAEPNHFEFYADLNGPPQQATMTITSETDITFALETSIESNWLSVSTGDDQITPSVVTLTVNSAHLDGGQYNDTVTIYNPLDDGSPYFEVKVPVWLQVGSEWEPYIVVTNPAFIEWVIPGDNLVKTLDIYEQFERTVNIAYTHNSPWLMVNPFGMPPYTTPMSMPVSISDADTLPVGIFFDTIIIYCPDNSFAETYPPVFIPVVLYNYVDAVQYGDSNNDFLIDIGDAVYLINYVFRDGPAPNPMESGDANCDRLVGIGDAVFVVNYVFRGGQAPCQTLE